MRGVGGRKVKQHLFNSLRVNPYDLGYANYYLAYKIICTLLSPLFSLGTGQLHVLVSAGTTR